MFLRDSHGVSDPQTTKPARKKITMKRKSVGVVKQGKKSVNVEFRSKRTVVKPPILESASVASAELEEKREEKPQEVIAPSSFPAVEIKSSLAVEKELETSQVILEERPAKAAENIISAEKIPFSCVF